jgi:putative phosphoribosyl transferase
VGPQILRDRGRPAQAARLQHPSGMDREVLIDTGATALAGTLAFPPRARGLVVLAHASGNGRHHPRNRHAAEVLQDRGLATLLLDLLTPEEEQEAARRSDVDLLADRLVASTDNLASSGAARGRLLGYLGVGAGASASLIAAARRPALVAAIVCRGGRPDLVSAWLDSVQAPTLLIVGERDELVLQANREAAMRLLAPHRLEVVSGATHSFEEPGALERGTWLAASWFLDRFADAPASIEAAAPASAESS